MKRIISLATLMISAVFLSKAQTPSIPFVEGFEHGLNKWVNVSTAGTIEATAVESIVGAQSLHITETGAGAGVQIDFSTLQEVNVISYYVRVAGANGGLFKAGNGHSGNNAVFHAEILGGNFVVTTAAGPVTICPVATNTWVHIEVKNINYMDQTFDVFVDGVLLGSKIGFAAAVPGVATLDIYNQSGADEAWWDAIFLGSDGFELPEVAGNNICANDTAHLTFSPAIALDSAGINIVGTNLNIGPVASDSMVNTKYPYLETLLGGTNAWNADWGGNMFDITANKDIAIYGFDVDAFATNEAEIVKIYYRTDTYVGHNTSNAGWLLLDSLDFYAQADGTPSYVALTKSLVVPAGETYGLYICISGEGINYTTGNGTNEVYSNEDFTVETGVGGSYFNLTYSPRVWNGRIYYKTAEAQKEAQVLATDTNGTNYTFGSIDGGNMFDIIAHNDIVIDSLDFAAYSAATGWVKVYYREGSYIGYITSTSGWALLDSVTVTTVASPALTGVPLKNQLFIPAGHTYGFYICADMSTSYFSGTFQPEVSDSNITVTQGHGGNYFNLTNTPRFWPGKMYYSVRNVDSVGVGPELSTFVANAVRGYSFVAPNDFVITGLRVPNDNIGNQWIEVVRFNYPMPTSTVTDANFVVLGYFANIAGDAIVPCNIFVAKGDHIGVMGYRKDGANTPVNSYGAATSPDTINILGHEVEIWRAGAASGLIAGPPSDVFTHSTTQICRVEMYVEPVTVHGGIDSVMIDVQTPNPDLGPDGDYCVQNTVILDPGAFLTYDWSTMASSPTITVDSTGTGLGNPVQYSVTVTDMYGCTASDTITITFIDCTSIEENNMSVKVYPNPSDDIFYISTENVNEAMLVQVFSLDGRLVKELNVNSPLEMIDMSSELSGVYSIRMTIKDQVKEMRIVLQ